MSILDKWNELKILVESIELDVHKNADGNASAGVRARLTRTLDDKGKVRFAPSRSGNRLRG